VESNSTQSYRSTHCPNEAYFPNRKTPKCYTKNSKSKRTKHENETPRARKCMSKFDFERCHDFTIVKPLNIKEASKQAKIYDGRYLTLHIFSVLSSLTIDMYYNIAMLLSVSCFQPQNSQCFNTFYFRKVRKRTLVHFESGTLLLSLLLKSSVTPLLIQLTVIIRRK